MSVSIYGTSHSNEEVELKLLIAGALPFIRFPFSLLKMTIWSERQQMGLCFMSCYLCCCLNGRITAVSTAVESDAWFLFQHMNFFLLQLKRNVNQATHLHRMVILRRFLTGSKRNEARWKNSMLNLGVLIKSKRIKDGCDGYLTRLNHHITLHMALIICSSNI